MYPHPQGGLVEHRFWPVNDLTFIGNESGVVCPVVIYKQAFTLWGGGGAGSLDDVIIHLNRASCCFIPLGETSQGMR